MGRVQINLCIRCGIIQNNNGKSFYVCTGYNALLVLVSVPSWYPMKLQRGQSTIEYVLLLAVVMLLISVVFKSPLFSKLLGEDSSFFKILKDRMEFSYRHTHAGANPDEGQRDISTAAQHDSYSKNSKSRFAGATSEYGGL